jgi:kumamolisin
VKDNISNATSGAPGYKAGPGWDACTGLGSIDGNALLAAL